jgi:hypothetical protein
MSVLVYPSKRWTDDEENISLADLNDTGSPLMELAGQVIGDAQLITEDVVAIISEQLLGLRAVYTQVNELTLVLPVTGLGSVPMLGARPGDPVYCDFIKTLAVHFGATVTQADSVNIYASAVTLGPAPVILAGTQLTVINFTSRRPPGVGPPPLPDHSSDDTGYLDVTPGYVWNPNGEAITTAKLDATARPTAAVKTSPPSVGRRELIPYDIAKIAAPVVSGLPFSGSTPLKYIINPRNSVSFVLPLTGAALGKVPIIDSPELADQVPYGLEWTGTVDTVNFVRISIYNRNAAVSTVPIGSNFFGRLI